MLFDLRARGRQTTVKIVYTLLAVLMAGGLVFFGIGGATNGGLLDAFKSSSSSGSDIYGKQVKSAQQVVRRNPKNPDAWARLARVQFQDAGTGDKYDSSTGVFTSKGLTELRQVRDSWNRYLALNPAKPDPNTANVVAQAFGIAGLRDFAGAVKAYDIIISNTPKPTYQQYLNYAIYASLAKQSSKAAAAGRKAVALAPAAQRATIQSTLKQAADQAAGKTPTTPQTSTNNAFAPDGSG